MMRMSFTSPRINFAPSSVGKTILRNSGLAIATLATLVCGLASPAFAQIDSNADPLEDFQTQDNGNDILSGDTQQGIQDLIHQINLSVGLSMEEFNVQRQENILSEADRFREMQRMRIDQEQSSVDAGISDTDIDSVDE